MNFLKKKMQLVLTTFILLILVNIIFVILPEFWAQLLIGKSDFSISLSFQDIMWVSFFVGLLALLERKKEIHKIQSYESKEYLPSKFEDLIGNSELTSIIKKTKEDANDSLGILPYMILQIALQFRTNLSLNLTSDFLSKQLDLFLHSVEIRYNKIKYIIWLIPSLGFMGTVYGIGVAVSNLGSGSLDDPQLLTKMASSLGIAFNTTLLALILSVVLQYLSQTFEAQEEKMINSFGKYILDNLINKIIIKK